MKKIQFVELKNGLKGTYYENNTFLGIWGVVLGLSCSHTHTNFEKDLYLIFLIEIYISESTSPTVTNKRVRFGAPCRGHT
jgi:hypothetical protein